MSTLRDLRQRLRSVENIKKITDTMERVAAARLKQAQAQAEQSRPYIAKLKDILEKVAATGISHPLFQQRKPVKKTGLVIVSSEKGLSGAYNANIFQAADRFLKKYGKEQVELILLGRKAIDYYRGKEWKVRIERTHLVEHRSLEQIKDFSDQLVHLFCSEELDEIWLIYTHYISVMKRKIIVEKFLNVGAKQLHDTDAPAPTQADASHYIFEPDPAQILSALLPRYCFTRIETVLYEAYASELAARIIAMQTASQNSKDMITQLTLIKNKTRQQGITREMIEISTGALGLQQE
ncbi:ATP synthase gamma chain [Chlamydiales bacterium STE3]|nr:ATP synthase gamma chain [Chlamydiales bacterium STE3]